MKEIWITVHTLVFTAVIIASHEITSIFHGPVNRAGELSRNHHDGWSCGYVADSTWNITIQQFSRVFLELNSMGIIVTWYVIN